MRVLPALPASTWRGLLAAAAAGLLARLLCIAGTTPLTLSSDEQRFWDLASTRMAGTAFLPPLQPFLLAALRAVTGDDVTMARIALAVLASGSIVLVGVLAERHLGPGVGVAPAWIAALLPTLLYYDGRLRSEPAVILLLLLFACLWSRPGARRLEPVIAGGCLGLASLGRPELLLLPFVLATIGWMRGDRARAIRRAALLAPGILALLVPWTMRNHGVTGAWTIVSANGGYNFWKSFNAVTDGSQVPLYASPWDGSAAIGSEAVGYREGIAFIRERPLRSALLAPAKVAHLFGPERDFLSDLRQGHVPSVPAAVVAGFAALQNAAWFALLAAGLYALAGPRRSDAKDVVVAVLAVLVLTHLVFFGDDRFHVLLLPFLCAMLPEAWDGRRRSAPLLVGIGLFLAVEAAFWIGIACRDAGRIAGLWGR
jgi:hypothetical protein